jgi:hypothetical protein
MFGSIVRLAQAEVENSIGHAVDKAIVAIPFVVAFCFAAAALAIYLVNAYGGVSGLLLMAAAFIILGALIVAFTSSRRPRHLTPTVGSGQPPTAEEQVSAAKSTEAADAVDHELLISTLTSLAPYTLPQLLRLILRNLPILTAIIAAGFVLTRPSDPKYVSNSAVEGDEGAVPAE